MKLTTEGGSLYVHQINRTSISWVLKKDKASAMLFPAHSIREFAKLVSELAGIVVIPEQETPASPQYTPLVCPNCDTPVRSNGVNYVCNCQRWQNPPSP
jgi:hypothetical protein